MTDLYQVVRYNRVLFEGDHLLCVDYVVSEHWFGDIHTDRWNNIQIWKKSVREYLNKNWR